MLRKIFERVAQADPQREALVDREERISYGELARRTSCMARLLHERGVRPGDRVAAGLPNCWEFAAGFLACGGLGAIWSPFPTEWRASEIGWLARRLSPRILVTSSALLPRWQESGAIPEAAIVIDDSITRDALRRSTPLSGPHPDDDAPCLCMATSGSTGRPRLVYRSGRNVLASAENAGGALGVRPGMRLVSVVPFCFGGGFNNCLAMPLFCGLTAILLPAFHPSELASAVKREQAELLMGSPRIYTMLLDSDVARSSLASLRVCLSFGAPIAPEVVHGCLDRLGINVRQLYGCTETGAIAIQPKDVPFQPGLAGRPVASTRVFILDEDGAPLPADRTGAVAVSGPAVITSYHDHTPLDEPRFRDGMFRTGDLGCIDRSGLLMLRGRTKPLINAGGVKVDPVEVEEVLRELTAVADCVARGERDERQGEVVTAVLVMRPGCSLDRREIIEHCRKRLAEYKIPRRITFADSPAATITGKRTMNWTTEEQAE